MDADRFHEITGLPYAWKGAKQDRTSYYSGITLSPTKSVGLICNSSTDLLHPKWSRWSGWNRERFHYCPEGSWADWVTLSRKIIEADEKLNDALYRGLIT